MAEDRTLFIKREKFDERYPDLFLTVELSGKNTFHSISLTKGEAASLHEKLGYQLFDATDELMKSLMKQTKENRRKTK